MTETPAARTRLLDPLRQHYRATALDRAVLAAAYRHTLDGRPDTRHLVVVEDHDASVLQRIWQGWVGE